MNGDDDAGRGSPFSVDFPTDFLLCGGFIVATVLMIIALMIKLMWNWEGEEERATENTGLIVSQKEEAVVFNTTSYGTTTQEDIESGKGSCSTSSSEELYDGKICVICYDDQRNCYFIPCGHSITCNNCTDRIMNEEIKSCPICRTWINKARMLKIL